MTNEAQEKKDEYPKAASGTGFILFRKGPKPNSLWAGCASRSAVVGVGYGISFGGFAAIKQFLELPVGSVRMMHEEAFREGDEEVTGIFDIISQDVMKKRRQILESFLVRTADVNQAHACVYYGCPVTEAEQESISALPPTEETTESLGFFLLEWPEGRAEDAVLNVPEPLYHKHEMVAFRALAKLAVRGRLEYMEA